MKRVVCTFGKLNWGTRAYAVFVLSATTASALPAQTFNTLYSFCAQGGSLCTDGAYPQTAFVQATNGDLYGTTSSGAVNGNSGTIFKITPSGTLTTLYSFCSQSECADGYDASVLIQAADGDFYGTTFGGGSSNSGTIFKITPSGALTTLYTFCSQSGCRDGRWPSAALVLATNGDFYGTTYSGGANDKCDVFGVTSSGCGTVFKITPSGKLTTLDSFCSQTGCADGAEPNAALVQAANGDLYGTTWVGGAFGQGTIVKITLGGKLTTVYSFCAKSGCTDGQQPSDGGLIQATNGNMYGTTFYGGAGSGGNNGVGTVFRITPSGKLTTLHIFGTQNGDGGWPYGVLVQATDGNLYGTTSIAGANAGGTVFKVTPSGKLTTLYSFCAQSGCTDGSTPNGLFQATNGDLYGTTYSGGNNCAPTLGCGTVFNLSVNLGPFVETQPGYGKVGAAVKLLGTDLTGATSVTFNGIAAAFTVTSPSDITTTVPTSATTGTVQVVTPGGTFSSNVPFRVLP